MKILMAEDDLVSAKLLELTLRQWGHDVVVAVDGAKALAEYSRASFDVVITDWMMPALDGLELARSIRDMRHREYPWVILLTTKSFKDNYTRAMEAGVDDFLTKPLDRELLRVRLAVAARVQRARKQVAELSRLLPICMHCKAVKATPEEGWRRVEEFLAKHSQVSHGYCPDCYWDKSVEPDLHAFLEARPAPAGETSPVDSASLAALDEFDRTSVPGIAMDARTAFHELVTTRMKADLDSAGMGVRLPPVVIARYRNASNALGAVRLAALFDRLAVNPFENAGAVRVELVHVLAALFPRDADRDPDTSHHQ